MCFLQGIGQLFPWNVFINAEDYFRRRLCGSAFENNFENCISAGYNVAAIAGLVLALRWGHLLPTMIASVVYGRNVRVNTEKFEDSCCV